MRFLAVVSYDGTNYFGWQIQPNLVTIQEEIEKAISKILNTPTKIYGSGRTDTGVHAYNQTFHFDSDKIVDIDKFRYSLNSVLPKDIYVKSITKVDDDFHARFDVKEKEYMYLLNNSGTYDVFNRRYINQFPQHLDKDLIKEGALLFIGKHDFKNFTTKEEDQDNFIRTINDINVIYENGQYIFIFKGDGFMRYMVRMIVGTLIELGLHKIDLDFIRNKLNDSKRDPVSFRAASYGLYLNKVKY